MRLKPAIATILAVTLVAAVVAPTGALAGKKKKKKKTPRTLVVGIDSNSDWGVNVDPEIQPIGDALGQELVEATINTPAGGGTLELIFGLNSLPASGGAPEVSRYKWSFSVDGGYAEVDGKFTNYSRGACDPTSGQCPPARDPGLYPFLVRGNCGVADGTNLNLCEEIGTVQATFDPAAATITVPIPFDMLSIRAGSKIEPQATIFGGSLYAAPSAFVTNNSMPLDTLVVLETYIVPKG